MNNMVSDIYQKMLASSPDAALEYVYNRWQMYNGTAAAQGSTIITPTAQSLDMLVAFFSPSSSYATTFTDNKGANTSALLGSSAYFLRPAAFTNVTSNGGVSFEVQDWSYSIGGKSLPSSFQVPNDWTIATNLAAMKSNNDLLGGLTSTLFAYNDTTYTVGPGSTVASNSAYGYVNTPLAKNYLAAYAAFVLRLNNDDEPGWISGLNSMGNTIVSNFNWRGTSTVPNGQLMNYVYAKSTASFIVKYGKQTEVVL